MRASILICADSASSLFYHSIDFHCARLPRCKRPSIIFRLLVLLRYVSRHSGSLTSLLLQGANQSISRHRKLSKEHQQHGQRLLQLWRFFAPGTGDRSYSSCIPLLSFRLVIAPRKLQLGESDSNVFIFSSLTFHSYNCGGLSLLAFEEELELTAHSRRSPKSRVRGCS